MRKEIWQCGEHNELTILRFTTVGAYLGEPDGHPDDVILLPNRYLTPGMKEGDAAEVFIYLDSEDRPVATTETPKVTLGSFAMLRAKDVNRVGAFMDWGLQKDLFVPFSEQVGRIEVGREYPVHLCFDGQTNRLYGSCRISRHVDREHIHLKEGQQVQAIVFSETELGFRVLIDLRYEGLLYRNEVFRPMAMGDSTTAFVRKVRKDGKVDVRLEPDGPETIGPHARLILDRLNDAGGILQLSDKSPPKLITDQLQISKKAFKRAIGTLYRKKLVVIAEDHISSVIQDHTPEGPRHLREDDIA